MLQLSLDLQTCGHRRRSQEGPPIFYHRDFFINAHIGSADRHLLTVCITFDPSKMELLPMPMVELRLNLVLAEMLFCLL